MSTAERTLKTCGETAPFGIAGIRLPSAFRNRGLTLGIRWSTFHRSWRPWWPTLFREAMKLTNPLRHPFRVRRIERPRAEGRFYLPDGRRLGFAEYGDPSGAVVL